MSVTAGESGPVLVLTGEADLTTVGQLSEMLTAQLADGTVTLLVDASGLSFADSVTVRALVLAARTLRERHGSLVLLHPQRPVARVLALLGADQMVTIRGGTEATPGPQPGAGGTQGEPAPGLRGPDADQPDGTWKAPG